MTTDQDAMARGTRAETELQETEAVFAKIRNAALEKLVSSKASETNLREAMYRTVQTVDAIQSHLRQIIKDGETAKLFAELSNASDGAQS